MGSRKKFLTVVGVGLAGVVLGSNRGNQKAGRVPQLEFAFTANITLGAVQEVGNTPHGRRRIIPITGGTFEGPSIIGTVEPGGGDWQIIRPDNVAELEAKYTLRTNDGVLIYIVNKGYRHGPAEVMQRLSKGEAVDPTEYYFRASPVFETASEKYNYLNKYVYLASGERKKESVVIHFIKSYDNVLSVMTTENAVESSPIQTEVKGEILFVRISRTQKRNALNEACMDALDKVFSNPPPSVRCAILYGEGKHFSAGVDLSELSEQNDLIEGLRHSRMWHRILDRLQFGTIPIITVLHGAVLGGGLELASATHIRVAEKSAFFALPEGQRGIFVGGGGSVRIPRLIGLARMTDMMMTGRVYSAEEGMAIGLSQYLVDDGTGMDKAIELAKKIASNAAATNYALMHVLPRISESNPEQGLMMESLIATITKNTPEAKERLKLFLDGKAKKIGE